MNDNKFGTTSSQTFTDLNGKETNSTDQNDNSCFSPSCCLSGICDSIISIIHYCVCQECCCIDRWKKMPFFKLFNTILSCCKKLSKFKFISNFLKVNN